jgi:hypothetical protein
VATKITASPYAFCVPSPPTSHSRTHRSFSTFHRDNLRALAALCPSLLDIRSIGYGLAVGMVGGEVRTVANEGQCAGILTPVSWSAIGLIRLPSLFL